MAGSTGTAECGEPVRASRVCGAVCVTVEPRPRPSSDESAAREIGRSRWTTWQQARAASSSSSSRRPRRRRSRATSEATSTSRRRSATSATCRTPSELPADMKKGPFGKFAVDVDNGFEAYYVVDPDKKKKVAELKRLLKDADELYLATDEDREGEAIAWHLLEVLKPHGAGQADGVPRDHPRGDPARRQRHPRARHRAWSTPRRPAASSTASTATRCRPVLWRKVRQGLSAGRVQSVATRMVVERERERMAFRAGRPTGTSRATSRRGQRRRREPTFTARLTAVDGDRVATGRDFADDGDAEATRRRPPRRGDRDARSPRRPGARRSRVTDVAGEALHASSVRAVHDLDPPAGGLAQAAAVARRTRCASPSGSTRTATSPTCVPTARRCRRPR